MLSPFTDSATSQAWNAGLRVAVSHLDMVTVADLSSLTNRPMDCGDCGHCGEYVGGNQRVLPDVAMANRVQFVTRAICNWGGARRHEVVAHENARCRLRP